jgi:hypothetical protein
LSVQAVKKPSSRIKVKIDNYQENHLQQRLPSASNELKWVMDNNDNGQANTRTLSPSCDETLADKNEPTVAASLIMLCSCMPAGVRVLQCRAASIHDAALCRQAYGAKPPETST